MFCLFDQMHTLKFTQLSRAILASAYLRVWLNKDDSVYTAECSGQVCLLSVWSTIIIDIFIGLIDWSYFVSIWPSRSAFHCWLTAKCLQKAMPWLAFYMKNESVFGLFDKILSGLHGLKWFNLQLSLPHWAELSCLFCHTLQFTWHALMFCLFDQTDQLFIVKLQLNTFEK